MPIRLAKSPDRRRHFIREWRLYRGMTQETLAEMVGTSEASISRVEAGRQNYTQPMVERIADALKTDPGTLLGRNPSVDDPIWAIVSEANPLQRKQIVELARALLRSS
jgi:transcriptional regulator with XRE-family HTH domain